MKFIFINLLIFCIISSLFTKTLRSRIRRFHVDNQPDWTKTTTFATSIANRLFADKDAIPKCIPPSWKSDPDIRSNKSFKKSLSNLKGFMKELIHYKTFLRKRVNYECHYAGKIKQKLEKYFKPKPPPVKKIPTNIPAPKAQPKPIAPPKKSAPNPKAVKKPAAKKKKKGGWFSKAASWVKNTAKKGLDYVKKGANKVKNAVSKAGNTVKGAIKNGYQKVKSAIKKGAAAVKKAAKKNAKKVSNLKEKDKKKPHMDASDGKIFEFFKQNFNKFKSGIMKFFTSKVFNSTVVMINCLKNFNPNEHFKKAIFGLKKTVDEIKQRKYIPIAIDFFCQWDKLRAVLQYLHKAFDKKNQKQQWELIAIAMSKLLEILKI